MASPPRYNPSELERLKAALWEQIRAELDTAIRLSQITGMTAKECGATAFPMDMLRYDACHPVNGDDVDAMFWKNEGQLRTVTLNSNRPPTVQRWSSFGWRVVKLI